MADAGCVVVKSLDPEYGSDQPLTGLFSGASNTATGDVVRAAEFWAAKAKEYAAAAEAAAALAEGYANQAEASAQASQSWASTSAGSATESG